MTFLAFCRVLTVLGGKVKKKPNHLVTHLKTHTHTCAHTWKAASHFRKPPFVNKALLLLYAIIIGIFSIF